MTRTPIRVALFDGPGRPFRFESVPRPRLGPGEALVKVTLCTVCGSDRHTFAGRRSGPTPCVLGHEAVGVVEEVAGEPRDVTGRRLRPGDRVVWGIAVSCGVCFFCRHGLPQKCERLRKYGHEPHRSEDGSLGGLATHCRLLAGTTTVVIPPEAGVPDVVAGPAACATATAVAACDAAGILDRNAMPGEAEVGVVFGVGMVGLAAVARAAEAGRVVVACDTDDSRLSLARDFGAAVGVKPAEVADAACSLTAGRGADFMLEMSGSPAAVAASLASLRVGGVAVWVGTVFPTAPVPLLPEVVVRRCLRLVGVHNYGPRHLDEAVRFLARTHRRFPFARLVEQTVPLDRVDEAFDCGEVRRPVRVAVTCDA